MENNPSRSSESPFRTPDTSGPEKDKDSKDSKDSKSPKIRKSLGKLLEGSEKAEPRAEPKKDSPALEKLLGSEPEKRQEPADAEREKDADAVHVEAEGELKINHLSQAEEREVASDYIDIRHADVREELAEVPEGTEAEQAAVHDEKWLEQAKAQIDSNPETPVSESLEEATQEIVAEMRDAVELPPEQTSSQFEAMAEEAIVHSQTTNEISPAEDYGEASPAQAAMFAATQEQIRQAGAAFENPAEPGQGETTARAGSRPEATKSSWYPSIVPWGSEVWHTRRWHLMRHRRERLKTEQKIKQAERSLQNEVRAVQEQVAGHEVGIRRMAAEQVRHQNERLAASADVPPHAHERYVATLREAILPAPPTPPEGHIAKLSEVVAPRGPIERPGRTSAESMPRDELLKESAGIALSGVTLRSIYESKRISEPGLRRLVAEYRRGGDMQLALAQEMVEHERSFERDPLLRDDHPMYEWLHPGGGTQNVSQASANSGDVARNGDGPMSSPEELRRLRRQKDRMISDGQFMTAGFTLLIIIVALIIFVLASR